MSSQFYLTIAIWSQIVSSVVFLGALIFMWLRWILPAVVAAQERSNKQIAEAERHRDEVKAALEMLRREVETAHHDADLIEQRVAARVEHERQAVLEETTQAGERTLEDARREFDRALAAGRQRLRDDLVARALGLAREDATRLADPALDARFVDRFTGSLEQAAHG